MFRVLGMYNFGCRKKNFVLLKVLLVAYLKVMNRPVEQVLPQVTTVLALFGYVTTAVLKFQVMGLILRSLILMSVIKLVHVGL